MMIRRATRALTESNEAGAGQDAVSFAETQHEEPCPSQLRSPRAQIHACKSSPNGRIAPVPSNGEPGKESPAESFRSLAARLNERFQKLNADLEHMRQQLGEGEERLAHVWRKLIENGALRG